MALRNASLIFKRFPRIKSELILDKLRGTNITAIVNKYQQILNQLNSVDILESRELLNFPSRTFNVLPTNTLKSIIKESQKFVEEKNLLSDIDLYNILLRSYMRNSIHIDVDEILKEINEKNIKFNETTYKILIEYHSNLGSMETVEVLLQKMKSENIKVDYFSLQNIMKGYIIAGEIDKSKAIIVDNNLNSNDIFLLINQGKGFALTGDMAKVKDIIEQIKKDETINKASVYITFFRLLAMKNVPFVDLKWILELIIKEENLTKPISDAIFQLNRTGLFNVSLELVEYFKPQLTEQRSATNLLRSFNSVDCPSSLYKYALVLLLDYSKVQQNLFYAIHYEYAMRISNDLINKNNCQSLLSSLFNKAISLKDNKLVERTLNFGLQNVEIDRFNSTLQYYVIPSILHSGMVKDYKEILKIQPKFHLILLPAILMYTLSKGQFNLYNEIKDEYPSYNNLNYSVNTKILAISILENLSFHEMDKFIEEANKSFSTQVINKMIAKIVVEKIISSTQNGNIESISEAVNLAMKYNILFKREDLDLLKTLAPAHIEIFSPLLQKVHEKSRNFRHVKDKPKNKRD